MFAPKTQLSHWFHDLLVAVFSGTHFSVSTELFWFAFYLFDCERLFNFCHILNFLIGLMEFFSFTYYLFFWSNFLLDTWAGNGKRSKQETSLFFIWCDATIAKITGTIVINAADEHQIPVNIKTQWTSNLSEHQIPEQFSKKLSNDLFLQTLTEQMLLRKDTSLYWKKTFTMVLCIHVMSVKRWSFKRLKFKKTDFNKWYLM